MAGNYSRDLPMEQTVVVTIESVHLVNVLSILEDYEPILLVEKDELTIKALNYGRTALLVHRVPISSISPNIDKPIKVYSFLLHGHTKTYIQDYIQTDDLNEPDVDLTTSILADNVELSKILRLYGWRDYSDVVFCPSNNHQLKLKFIDGNGFEITIDKSVARLLRGNDLSRYKLRLLLANLAIIRRLGVNRIEMKYSIDAPMVIKPFSRDYPRIWIAPCINE